MKKSELKELKDKDINERLNELRRELMKINTQRAVGSLPENPGNVKKIRRTIARLLNKKREFRMGVRTKG